MKTEQVPETNPSLSGHWRNRSRSHQLVARATQRPMLWRGWGNQQSFAVEIHRLRVHVLQTTHNAWVSATGLISRELNIITFWIFLTVNFLKFCDNLALSKDALNKSSPTQVAGIPSRGQRLLNCLGDAHSACGGGSTQLLTSLIKLICVFVHRRQRQLWVRSTCRQSGRETCLYCFASKAKERTKSWDLVMFGVMLNRKQLIPLRKMSSCSCNPYSPVSDWRLLCPFLWRTYPEHPYTGCFTLKQQQRVFSNKKQRLYPCKIRYWSFAYLMSWRFSPISSPTIVTGICWFAGCATKANI